MIASSCSNGKNEKNGAGQAPVLKISYSMVTACMATAPKTRQAQQHLATAGSFLDAEEENLFDRLKKAETNAPPKPPAKK